MSVLLKWLVRWLSAETPQATKPLPLQLPVAREWTPTDKNTWRTFLQGGTGVTLMQRMTAMASANAKAASHDAMHSAHSAGRAAGFYDAITWLESLAVIEFEPISGADAEQSATSAQSQQGEDSLRELLSP